MLQEVAAVGIGGAIGSIARYMTVMTAAKLFGDNYTHYGTLAVNCVGSFLVTLFMALYIEKFDLDPLVRLFVVVGFLGGFTTFSSFSYESIAMLQAKQFNAAILHILFNNALGLSFAFLGLYVAKKVIQ